MGYRNWHERRLAQLRETVRDALPPMLVHAYRVVRHTMFWPSEQEMVGRDNFSPPTRSLSMSAPMLVYSPRCLRDTQK